MHDVMLPPTPLDVDRLPAGPELDACIAAMFALPAASAGEPIGCPKCADRAAAGNTPLPHNPPTLASSVPAYSSGEVTWQVVELVMLLHAQPLTLALQHDDGQGIYRAQFGRHEGWGGAGETLPLAICRAAYKTDLALAAGAS